jgi:acyl carrier protein
MPLSPEQFDTLRVVVADTLEVEPGEIGPATCAATLPVWDSLAHLMIINAIEQRFAIKIPKITAYKVKNVGELADAVAAALA